MNRCDAESVQWDAKKFCMQQNVCSSMTKERVNTNARQCHRHWCPKSTVAPVLKELDYPNVGRCNEASEKMAIKRGCDSLRRELCSKALPSTWEMTGRCERPCRYTGTCEQGAAASATHTQWMGSQHTSQRRHHKDGRGRET